MIEYTEYRLAFILPESHQLLGLKTNGVCELPQIKIPLWRRPAEQLTHLIEETWKIKTLVLDVLSDESQSTPCAVIEVRSPTWRFGDEGFSTVRISSLSSLSLGETERAALISILSGGDADRGPFSRIGWIEETQKWIKASINDREVDFTGDLRHLNASGHFCLLRLGTASGCAYWLKAVGIPNVHEFGITTYLFNNCPQYLPRIVATREEWHAWVMEEFGSSLHHSTSLEDFKRAALTLAGLQRHLVGKSEHLLAVHCGDHRAQTLDPQIDEIMDYCDEAMRLQSSMKAPRVGTERLRELGDLVHRACDTLQTLGIPDSLMHSDISPGSILSDGSDCVLTDWCEAYVGNPFISFEQLCVHAARKTDEPESWVSSLRRVYKSCWADLLTETQIETALQLSPLVSVFSYLYGRGEWLHSSRRHEPAVQAYARSLSRHMDRIATKHNLTEALC
jgi:hypothetical protein